MTKIACWTLFNITQTGILNRKTPPVDVDIGVWTKNRNTQCNYDTLLQIISLRGQPEDISIPRKIELSKNNIQYFGTNYKRHKSSYCWTFDFVVTHSGVFNNGIHDLGFLFNDSNQVPMILIGNEVKNLSSTLISFGTEKNIHYHIINHDID